MYYGRINKNDIANGEGVRVTIWVSGCETNCPGCFNKESQDFEYGTLFTDDTMQELIEALEPDYIQGLTILGGEPLHQRNKWIVSGIVHDVKKHFNGKKDIWLYTGYKYENIDPWFIDGVDVLVDGPFIEEQKDITLKFRGSKNQRIIRLSQK